MAAGKKDAGAVAVEKLSEKQAKSELARLAEAIAHHDRLYYQKDAPEISDAEYDALRQRNAAIEAKFPALVQLDSPSRRIGATPAQGFAKVTHLRPMLSLGNAFSAEDVQEFVASVRRFLKLGADDAVELSAEPKIDGLSANLRYENGVFVQGATRGDGREGEDVTANLRTIADIPHTIKGAPDVLEVRGEVYMEKKAFAKMNAGLEAEGKQTYVNPRNSAAGALRQLDAKITATRPLRFFVHGWGELSEPLADTQYEAIQRLAAWGFPLASIQRCKSADELLAVYEKIQAGREKLAYEIDGVVYKVDSLALQQRLGFVSRSPRWAIAHKFAAEQAETVLEGIDIQVGRTGALTPVGRLKPVFVGGVTVTNVTLHNRDYIAGVGADGVPIRGGKDLRLGDTVIIQRAGDVIPQIVDVLLEKRKSGAKRYAFPEACPRCGSHVARELEPGEEGVVTRCTGGLNCPAQVVERLKHFASRRALDIEGLGDKQIEEFHDLGWLKEPADIFKLKDHRAELSEREGYGEKSVTNLLAAIEARREIEFSRFLYGLGIRDIGETTAGVLARRYETWEAFEDAVKRAVDAAPGDAFETLKRIPGVGAGALHRRKLGDLRSHRVHNAPSTHHCSEPHDDIARKHRPFRNNELLVHTVRVEQHGDDAGGLLRVVAAVAQGIEGRRNKLQLAHHALCPNGVGADKEPTHQDHQQDGEDEAREGRERDCIDGLGEPAPHDAAEARLGHARTHDAAHQRMRRR